MPLMQDMIVAGESQHWFRILDLGCGDGRLERSAADAYRFANAAPRPGFEVVAPYTEGVEESPHRAREAVELGVDYVHCMRLDRMNRPEPDFQTPALIIANPPFSQAQEFLEYALVMRAEAADWHQPKPTVIFLLRLNFMGAQKRYPFWSAAERPKLRVLSQRPSFTEGGTDMTDYAWFIWTDRDIPALDWYAPQGSKED